MPWACRTRARGHARREVSVQDGSGGPGRQGGPRPGPHVPVEKPPRTVTDSPVPARLRALLPFSPHCCLHASPQDGVPRGDLGRGPAAPRPVHSRGAAAPGRRWTRAGTLRHRAGAPGHGVQLQSSVPARVARGPGGDAIRLGISRNPSAPAASAGHSLRKGRTAGGRAAGGGHPVLSRSVPASRGSGHPQTFCVSGRGPCSSQ